jgi:acyl-CoA reductase-like NAD-dependent aldehyde dehydrogenase
MAKPRSCEPPGCGCPARHRRRHEAVRQTGTEWESVWRRCRSVAPEAFQDGRPLNFWGGRWRLEGTPTETTSPLDGTVLAGPTLLETADAKRAVRASLNEHRTWCLASLAERTRRVLAALDDLTEHRDLLALLLVWEMGQTWQAALSDVDSCLDAVRRGAGQHEPLPGPVSHRTSCERPMGVLMRAMLAQALTGNAAVAKAPAGGVHCLTLATALAARHGVPLTLVSGGEAELAEALVTSSMLGSVSYLEQDRRDCRGVWEFSDWPSLTSEVRAAAGRRYVVQRSLLDDFLGAYLPAVRNTTFGHPLAVSAADDPLPALDFGPLPNDVRVKELQDTVDDAISRGGVPLHRASLGDGRFVPGQDTAAYLAPVSILNPPPSSPLHHADPCGPVDTVVLVDTEAELLAAMGAGSRASFVCDDEATAARLRGNLRAA